jgi:hypothetical protein
VLGSWHHNHNNHAKFLAVKSLEGKMDQGSISPAATLQLSASARPLKDYPMPSHIFAPVLFLTLGPSVLAYTAAPARSFAKVTADGRFVFVMLTPHFDGQSATPEEKELRRKYPKGGLYANDGKRRCLWAVDWYADTVYPASDGIHVVRVYPHRGYWLGGSSRGDQQARLGRFEALALYSKGRLVRAYTLGELIDTGRFSDEQLNTWFHWFDKAELNEKSNTVLVQAATGEQVVVDYRSGEVVSRDGFGLSSSEDDGWGWVAALVGVGVVVVGAGLFLGLVLLLGRRATS